MLKISSDQKKILIAYEPELPLAMYRELAAHLYQVDGVTTQLIWSTSQQFDYHASQIAAIEVIFDREIDASTAELVEAILNHYGSWQIRDRQISA